MSGQRVLEPWRKTELHLQHLQPGSSRDSRVHTLPWTTSQGSMMGVRPLKSRTRACVFPAHSHVSSAIGIEEGGIVRRTRLVPYIHNVSIVFGAVVRIGRSKMPALSS